MSDTAPVSLRIFSVGIRLIGNGLIILGGIAMLLSLIGTWPCRCAFYCSNPRGCGFYCGVITAADVARQPAEPTDRFVKCRNLLELDPEQAYSFMWYQSSPTSLRLIVIGATSAVYLTVVRLILSIKHHNPHKWAWIRKLRLAIAGLLIWPFWQPAMLAWIAVAGISVGAIWNQRRKPHRANIVILLICANLFAALGLWAYPSQVDFSGLQVALYVHGIIVAGVVIDYVSEKLYRIPDPTHGLHE